MIIDHKLSFTQKAKERKKLLFFSSLNGISSVCISTNILSLFLLQSGFSAALVTIAISLINVGTFSVLFSKFLITKHGSATTMAISWLLKGMAAFIIVLIPFAFKYLPFNLYAFLIMLFLLIFYLFRSLGNPAMEPLFADLTDKDNRGKFTSMTFLNYNIAMFIGLIGCYFLFTAYHNSIFAFQGVIFIGVIANFICSGILSRVNESTYSEKSSEKFHLIASVMEVTKDKEMRNFILSRGFSVTFGALIVAVSIIALKKIYNISDALALIFILTQIVGSIVISYISKMISEYTGPKPLMIIYLIGNMIIAAFWIFAPTNIHIFYFIIIFFIGGVVSTGLTTSTFHQFILIVPQDKAVGYSLLLNLTTSLIGAVIGITVGGGLIKLLTQFGFTDLNTFKIFYLILFFVLIPMIYIISRQRSNGDWNVNKVFKLILSPKNMYSLYTVNKMAKFQSVKEEMEAVTELANITSNLSEKKLLYYLKSPYMLVRTRALRGLAINKLTKLSNNALIEELKTGEHSTGYMAAYVVGRSKIKEAIPTLRKYLDSDDNILQGHSMVALAQMKDQESYDRIKKILVETTIPIVILTGSIALSRIKSKDLPIIILNKLMHMHFPDSIEHEMLYYAAHYFNVGNEYYKYLRMFREDGEQGTYWLIDLLKTRSCHYKLLENYYKGKTDSSEVIKYFINIFKYSDNRILIDIFQLLKEIENTDTELCNEVISLLFVLLLSNEVHPIR
ncbi:MAG: MFS transporter [bacterium]|nr:MFS transporter [bacterium]